MIVTNEVEGRFIIDIGAHRARPSFKEVKEAVDKYAPPGAFMALIFNEETEEENPFIHRLIQIDEHTQDLMNNVREWSDRTFGTNHKSVIGKINHLREEIDELEAEILKTFDAPKVIETTNLHAEIADVNLLWLDIVALLGLTVNELNKESVKKFKEVQAREYGKPDENGVSRHIKK